MISWAMITDILDSGVVLGKDLKTNINRTFSGMEVLGTDHTPSDPNTLYIGSKAYYLALRDYPSEDILIIIACDDGIFTANDTARISYIAVHENLYDLVNRISREERRFDNWNSSIHSGIFTEKDLSEFFRYASRPLIADIYLLTSGYRIRGKHLGLKINVLEPQINKDSFPESLIKPLSYGQWNPLFPENGQSYSCRLDPIFADSVSVSGHILSVRETNSITPYTEELSDIFADIITLYNRNYFMNIYKTANRTDILVADLINGRIAEKQELFARVKNIQLKLRGFYHLLVFEPFRHGIMLPARMLSEIQQMFPEAIVCKYQNDIVAIVQGSDDAVDLTYNKTRLKHLCERNDSIVCISPKSMWLTSLNIIYPQAKKTLQYARTLNKIDSGRIIKKDEFFMYQIADLCVLHSLDYFGSNPTFLCHTGILTLDIKDEDNGTDLCHIYQEFLQNDCNITKTSESLKMHRNTLIRKLAKIEKTVGEDYSNPRSRASLLFSLIVVDYLHRYQGRERIPYPKMMPTLNDLQKNR